MSPTMSLRQEACSWVPTDTGEVIVLDLRSSTYFRLNATGAALWQQLSRGSASPAQLQELLTTTWDIDDASAKRDVDAFLGALDQRDLLA